MPPKVNFAHLYKLFWEARKKGLTLSINRDGSAVQCRPEDYVEPNYNRLWTFWPDSPNLWSRNQFQALLHRLFDAVARTERDHLCGRPSRDDTVHRPWLYSGPDADEDEDEDEEEDVPA